LRIQVFYLPDCPHHAAAVKRLRAVLSAERVPAEIDEVAVTDAIAAEEYKFRGSPTIRINGCDIAGPSPEPESFALACRLYPGANPVGLPPEEMIQRAIREARTGEQE
jgi:hypothetical protein